MNISSVQANHATQTLEVSKALYAAQHAQIVCLHKHYLPNRFKVCKIWHQFCSWTLEDTTWCTCNRHRPSSTCYMQPTYRTTRTFMSMLQYMVHMHCIARITFPRSYHLVESARRRLSQTGPIQPLNADKHECSTPCKQQVLIFINTIIWNIHLSKSANSTNS